MAWVLPAPGIQQERSRSASRPRMRAVQDLPMMGINLADGGEVLHDLQGFPRDSVVLSRVGFGSVVRVAVDGSRSIALKTPKAVLFIAMKLMERFISGTTLTAHAEAIHPDRACIDVVLINPAVHGSHRDTMLMVVLDGNPGIAWRQQPTLTGFLTMQSKDQVAETALAAGTRRLIFAHNFLFRSHKKFPGIVTAPRKGVAWARYSPGIQIHRLMCVQ